MSSVVKNVAFIEYPYFPGLLNNLCDLCGEKHRLHGTGLYAAYRFPLRSFAHSALKKRNIYGKRADLVDGWLPDIPHKRLKGLSALQRTAFTALLIAGFEDFRSVPLTTLDP